MSRRRKDDPDVAGVLVVDKPMGMTSHDVVSRLRRALDMRRIGHTGTLDPAATGVLVCAVGRATRLVPYLQSGRKTYQARVVLGRSTTTQDAEGEIVDAADASAITREHVESAAAAFVGEIEQVPPMVSAVKVDGERLYAKARRGEEVERDPRRVVVHELRVGEFVPGIFAEVVVEVVCSSGTYIRTLAHDLGAALAVGGSLLSLRRTVNEPFDLTDAMPLDDVMTLGEQGRLREHLIDPLVALRSLPTVEVDRATVEDLVHGRKMAARGFEGPYVVEFGGRLVGVYEDHDGVGKAAVVMLRPHELS